MPNYKNTPRAAAKYGHCWRTKGSLHPDVGEGRTNSGSWGRADAEATPLQPTEPIPSGQYSTQGQEPKRRCLVLNHRVNEWPFAYSSALIVPGSLLSLFCTSAPFSACAHWYGDDSVIKALKQKGENNVFEVTHFFLSLRKVGWGHCWACSCSLAAQDNARRELRCEYRQRQLYITLMNSFPTPRELLLFCGWLICPVGLKVVPNVLFVCFIQQWFGSYLWATLSEKRI